MWEDLVDLTQPKYMHFGWSLLMNGPINLSKYAFTSLVILQRR
jgi:hypothetical protein